MNSWIKATAVAAAVMATPLIAQQTLGSGGGAGQSRGGGMGMLRMADTNGDGAIEASERPGRRGPAPAMEGASPPTDGGGHKAHRTMTREQFRAVAMRRFDRLDTNHDGKIDQTEMAAAATLMRARRVGAGGDMTAPPSE